MQELENRIEALLAENPQGEELVRLLMEFYGRRLYRMLEMTHDMGGQQFVEELARDPEVGSMLVLHDLHPLDVESRVAQALETVRPQLGSHGGNVTLLGVREGVALLRLEGNCHGCAASQRTLRDLIGQAVEELAPEVQLELEAATPHESPYQTCPS